MKKLFVILILVSGLSASTMFTLSGIEKVYPVVEISGKDLPKEFKATAQGD